MPAPAMNRALSEALAAPIGMSSTDWNRRKTSLARALRLRMHAASGTGESWLGDVPDDAVIRAYVLVAWGGGPELSDDALRRFILDVRDAEEFSTVLWWMMQHVDRTARNDMCLRGTWRTASVRVAV
jgi:hypothetical protein